MGSNEEACAAIEALDSQFVWDGMVSPMVVKWMDAALQKRRREEHLAAMRQGLVPSMAMGERLVPVTSTARHHLASHAPASLFCCRHVVHT